jgi:hypothetical protein
LTGMRNTDTVVKFPVERGNEMQHAEQSDWATRAVILCSALFVWFCLLQAL